VLTDAEGVPLVVKTTPANTRDDQLIDIAPSLDQERDHAPSPKRCKATPAKELPMAADWAKRDTLSSARSTLRIPHVIYIESAPHTPFF
jgi:hypothetical protein